MNNVNFESQKLWRKDFDNGSAYSISLSTKLQDGNYVSAYIPIRFAQSANAPELIHNGTLANFSGFLTSDSKGKPFIRVTSLTLLDEPTRASVDDIGVDSFKAAEEDIPF